jgi:hypothetical protein
LRNCGDVLEIGDFAVVQLGQQAGGVHAFDEIVRGTITS